MSAFVRGIATELLILTLVLVALGCALAGRTLADWYLDYSLGLVGIYAGHRSVKNMGEVIASRGKVSISAAPADGSPR